MVSRSSQRSQPHSRDTSRDRFRSMGSLFPWTRPSLRFCARFVAHAHASHSAIVLTPSRSSCFNELFPPVSPPPPSPALPPLLPPHSLPSPRSLQQLRSPRCVPGLLAVLPLSCCLRDSGAGHWGQTSHCGALAHAAAARVVLPQRWQSSVCRARAVEVATPKPELECVWRHTRVLKIHEVLINVRRMTRRAGRCVALPANTLALK